MWYQGQTASREPAMDVTSAITQIEAAVSHQLNLAGHDPAVEAAAEAVLAALAPAVRQTVAGLAEQAAAEVNAQLAGQRVDVVLSDGEPTLVVRSIGEEPPSFAAEDFEARLTLRLPGGLKSLVEQAASEAGDSVNSFVVKTLHAHAAAAKTRTGRRFKGTVQT